MVLKCLQNFKGESAGHVTKDSWPESSDFYSCAELAQEYLLHR